MQDDIKAMSRKQVEAEILKHMKEKKLRNFDDVKDNLDTISDKQLRYQLLILRAYKGEEK